MDTKLMYLNQLHSALSALLPLIAGKEYVGVGHTIESAEETYGFLVSNLEGIAAQLSGDTSDFDPGENDIWNLLRMTSNNLMDLRRLADSKVTRAIGLVVNRLLSLLAAYNFNSEGHKPAQGEYRYNLDILFNRLRLNEPDLQLSAAMSNESGVRSSPRINGAVEICRLLANPFESLEAVFDQAMEIFRQTIVQESLAVTQSSVDGNLQSAEEYLQAENNALERIRQALQGVIWIARGVALQRCCRLETN